MGPFASKNVIKEIQIRQGKWISVLGQISDTEPSKEATETTEAVIEEDSTAEIPKVSSISQTMVFLIAVFGVLLVIILVLLIRGRAS